MTKHVYYRRPGRYHDCPNYPKLPNTIKLSVQQSDTLRLALVARYRELVAARDYSPAKAMKLLLASLPPKGAADFSFYQHEWPALSRALRPEGPAPKAGTRAMQFLNVYRYLCKHQGFRIK